MREAKRQRQTGAPPVAGGRVEQGNTVTEAFLFPDVAVSAVSSSSESSTADTEAFLVPDVAVSATFSSSEAPLVPDVTVSTASSSSLSSSADTEAILVPDVAVSTASSLLESSTADTASAATDLPTGAAVAKQLLHFDLLARDGTSLARNAALRELDTMKKWASSNDITYVAFIKYFQRYGGPARMLDFLKGNMADTELVGLICRFYSSCMSVSTNGNTRNVVTVDEFRKQFVDLDGIQTLLLANDEHFATNTDSSLLAANTIWWCLERVTLWCAYNKDGIIAMEKFQSTLVTDAACDWLEKLSTIDVTTAPRETLLDVLLGTLGSQMAASTLKSGDMKTKKIIPTALEAVLRSIGKWKRPLIPEGIFYFFSWCSKMTNLLTHSQFQELLPWYIYALTEYPLEQTVSTWTISFLEDASSFINKQVMKKSGVCVALIQFDISDAPEDMWKARARKIVRELCE